MLPVNFTQLYNVLLYKLIIGAEMRHVQSSEPEGYLGLTDIESH